MNLFELAEAAEKLTDAQKQEILGTDLGADLEKEASAEVANADFEAALYAYGAFKADLEVESAIAGETGLNKEASAHFEAAEQELSAAIEAGAQELGLDEIENDADLHKTAMACAAMIMHGYADQMEKMAGMKEKAGAAGKWLADKARHYRGKAVSGAKHVGGKAKDLGKKHGRHAAMVAGGAALGYGAREAKERMHKKASELTAGELIDMALDRQVTIEVIEEGIDKLANWSAKIGEGATKAKNAVMGAAKAHGGKAALVAGGAGAGYLAHKMRSKKEK
jgi:hypothetical protein